MFFYQIFILILIQCFLSCNTLRCTTNCSFTYNFTTPFKIPEQCNQMKSAGKCIGSLQFWYEREEYIIGLNADSSKTIFSTDNRRFVMLQFPSPSMSYLSYDIRRTCKNKDDCARDLITNVANEMFQREYNYSQIMNDFQPLLIDDSLPSSNTVRNCYDSKQNVQQCGTLTKPGSCFISNDVLKKKTSFACDTEMIVENAYISIYHSDDYINFDVHCNRSLCNTQSTLQAAKDLMYKYNITITPDGRLNGSRLIISTSLMIMMILFLNFNQL